MSVAVPGDPATFTRSRSLHNRMARVTDKIAVGFCWAAALITITSLFAILGYILYRGISSMSLQLFTNLPSDTRTLSDGTTEAAPGMRSCIEGTLILIGLASAIGVPVGMACGIYLAEFAKGGWFTQVIRLIVDVLSGVPSILVGVLASVLFVRPVNHNSAWAGAAALAFIMCPIVSRTTEEMLKLVPKALREASIGLGASRAQTLFKVVLPAASGGVITGVMLAVARVAGETAPLIFTVLGWNQALTLSQLNGSFPALTLKIYEFSGQDEPEKVRLAWAGMLILIMLVLVLNISVRVISNRKRFGKA